MRGGPPVLGTYVTGSLTADEEGERLQRSRSPASFFLRPDLLDGPHSSLVDQRCLPAIRETRVRSLGREEPLEQEMATHSKILAWRIPRTEKPGGLQSMGSQRVEHD